LLYFAQSNSQLATRAGGVPVKIRRDFFPALAPENQSVY